VQEGTDADMNVKESVFKFFISKGKISGQTEEEQLAYPYLDERFIDSLGIVEMVLTFEKEFGIHFEPRHMQSRQFRTIGGLIILIQSLMEGKSCAKGS
jgi:acyl carrier protein